MQPAFERKWKTKRGGGRSVADASRTSYYGVPVIHKAHWGWEIYLYFFLGGISGASYVIASLVQWLGGSGAAQIVRLGRYLSLATLIPSPLLLIMDLKRPERFYNMLRVVKFRSPMSVGTWGLLIFSAFSALSALIQATRDGLLGEKRGPGRLLSALPERAIGTAGTIPGFFLSGYTGVLLAATAVPLWARNYLLMGPLFIASSVSNAAAAMTLILSSGRKAQDRTIKRLERLDVLALSSELLLLLAARRNLGPVMGRPIREGKYGRILKYGVHGIGVLAPLALQMKSLLLDKKVSRMTTMLTSTMALIGGFLLRYVMVMGGHLSADDPEATFEFTRANGHRTAGRSG